ncbi:CAP domain-containing protein [Ideonella livida]|uniref:CAP domain-containing protein n=1 Tax=Ideonella livida TaxID=2707176 RepID=UPI001940261A|nr:CAP domain-containing protein [Ideonella livida]
MTGTASVPEAVGSSIPRAAAQAALDLHNSARQDVGTRPLLWSPELSAFAQKWAHHLAQDKGCRMEHRPGGGPWGSRYGENIFWGSASRFNARDAAKAWYDEIRDWRPGILTGDNWHKTGHYTQMVWKGTTHVGMGQAHCPSGAVIIVANYDPPGNYMGQSPY